MNHSSSLLQAIQGKAQSLDGAADLNSLINRVGESRLVMLGEATHGTDEFYQWRSLITQRLIEEKGFSFIAVEGDWPECMAINRFIWGQEGSALEALQSFNRWPTWMWANTQIGGLMEWLRWYNQSQRNHCVGFYGMDVYSLFSSIREVNTYLQAAAPSVADHVKQRFSCFDPFAGDEIAYARSTLQTLGGCAQPVLENFYEINTLSERDVRLNGMALLDAKQNARIIRNAERYYRTMVRDDVASWNIRDRHMLETINLLLSYGHTSKGIVWAHNSHIGDYHATDMEAAGYVNLGGITREYHGEEDVVLIGFGTYEGEVLAAHAWDGPAEVMPIPPAQPGSYEAFFHEFAEAHGTPHSSLIFDPEDKKGPLAERRGHRAIGVVYDPLHDRRNHFVPTSLANRYDAFIFIDTTHALQPIYAPAVAGYVPQTWPKGE